MQRHFEKELESLKTTIIRMGSLAEEAVRLSIQAALEGDGELAKKVIESDERLNSLEIEIDDGIVDILALQQPVAVDLRLILAAQKINNDLERIGDHAVNIAESARELTSQNGVRNLFELPEMGEIARSMLSRALDGFIHNDPNLGMMVLKLDDRIDNLNRTTVRGVIERMKSDQNSIEEGMEIIRVSRNLERIADLATNIAEEVIFIAQARVVKHHADDSWRPGR